MKCFYERMFVQKKIGHKCDLLWIDLRDKLLSDGYDVGYFDDFFKDKEKCCSDGFSGRYYKQKDGKQYLMHSVYIDIGSMHSTVHKFIDDITNILRRYFMKADNKGIC